MACSCWANPPASILFHKPSGYSPLEASRLISGRPGVTTGPSVAVTDGCCVIGSVAVAILGVTSVVRGRVGSVFGVVRVITGFVSTDTQPDNNVTTKNRLDIFAIRQIVTLHPVKCNLLLSMIIASISELYYPLNLVLFYDGY